MIHTVEIAGKQLNLRFGMHVAEMLLHDASGRQKIGTIQFMSMLIFYAHENYCLGYDMQPELSKGEIYRFLEDKSNDEALALQLKSVLDAYNQSQPAKDIKKASESLGAVSKKKD